MVTPPLQQASDTITVDPVVLMHQTVYQSVITVALINFCPMLLGCWVMRPQTVLKQDEVESETREEFLPPLCQHPKQQQQLLREQQQSANECWVNLNHFGVNVSDKVAVLASGPLQRRR